MQLQLFLEAGRSNVMVIAQEQKKFPIHRLKLDVVTRWESAYDMVKRVLKQMEVIRIVFGGDRNLSHLIPTWQDCDVLVTSKTSKSDD